jgi:hypothetical protein
MDEGEKTSLTSRFKEFIEKTLHQKILENQIEYALRLMKYNVHLEYEEIHKLYSLADEIFALDNLGILVDVYIDFEQSFKKFLREEPRTKMVAKDKFENWKKDWWWYKI